MKMFNLLDDHERTHSWISLVNTLGLCNSKMQKYL